MGRGTEGSRASTRVAEQDPRMLNRAALIVRPGAPFIAWAKSLDDSGALPDPTTEQTVYLVDGFDHSLGAAENEAAILESAYEEVFARELFLWHTVEGDWPKKRTLAMFKQWFSIEIHSSVDDLGAEPLEDDE